MSEVYVRRYFVVQLPLAVIEAARQRRVGFGEYVNNMGQVVRPSLGPRP